MINEWTLVGRLVLAALFGGMVGYERQRLKTAGLRTHLLVCLGSCLIMVLSINIYGEVQGLTNADPARLAAQVVSGIGFLGAGTILKEGLTIKGLTTAASLWVVAAIGLAVGSGYYLAAFATAALSIFALTVLPRVERLYTVGTCETQIVVKSEDKPGQIGKIGTYLGSVNAHILDIKLESLPEKQVQMTFFLNCPNKRIVPEIRKNLASMDAIISVEEERNSH
ncbi:MAG: MgtC/SapB family protein [Sporomusaceae bacterium]|jgi:putative Mg2+ transporter-C (MgtC) family protein|nr:MgtC/SapB family protein [Sporomusaceae bacterium]